ncbi:MAG: succinate--CoA ligase subunit alpha [Anaerolineales bacterium]|nr:succinate--CoA ligase subunit alpha [Anaerolineales bacterium]
MSILVDENTRVVVQGATGREAILRIKLMQAYGTQVLAGVTPGKGGQYVEGVPIYNTVLDAREHHPDINTSAIFVPALAAKLAAMEALDSGIRVITLHPERVAQQDMLEVIAYAKRCRGHVIGPNTIGLVSPGKALVGMIGGNPTCVHEFFRQGEVGVLSRSGGNTTTLAFYINQAGLGQSTAIGMGGDAFVGTTLRDFLALFEKDPETKMVAYFGEIGTSVEEDAAEFIRQGGFTKPMVAYISGRYARPNMRFGHAGAMITGGTGTAQAKREALRSAGVHVVDHFGEIGLVAHKILAAQRGV